MHTLSLVALAVLAAPLTLGLAPSDVPPEGPPWKLTYRDARAHALQRGQPVFVYFTKTYCPHCVPVDEMLTNDALEKVYEKVTWLFVTRNFKGDEKDREAYRTHDRFGMSSWPQLIVFDPRSDEIVAEPPRDLEGFLATLERSAVEHRFRPRAEAVVADAATGGREDRPTSARERAIAFEDATLRVAEDPDATPAIAPEAALEALRNDDEDLVVRIRAVRYLAAVAPELAAEHAPGLLDVANDPLRYDLLQLLAKHPNPQSSSKLATIFRDAGRGVPSRNPNVLRGHAARALATCGDAAAAGALREIAVEANPLNSTTRLAIEALAGIGARTDARGRAGIVTILLDAFPAGHDDPAFEGRPAGSRNRMVRALATSVRDALVQATGREDLPAVPEDWSTKARESYVRTLRSAIRD